MAQYELRNENIIFLNQIEVFADALLAEVLEQRGELDNEFYLPGFPVTDSEVLGVLQNVLFPLQSSEKLLKAWGEVLKSMDTEGVGAFSPRMVQLRWFYSLDSVWMLAVLLAFVYEKEPKYEKVFMLLQGDSGRRGIDLFLVEALASYLGMKNQAMHAKLWSESQIKAELFEESAKGELRLRKNVFLWLYGKEEIEISKREIFHYYLPIKHAPRIFEKKSMACEALLEKQIAEKIKEPLLFQLQGRKAAGKKVFAGRVATHFGYGLCVMKFSALLEKTMMEREQLVQEFLFFCRVKGTLPYMDLLDLPEDGKECISVIEKIAGEYSVLFLATEPESLLLQKAGVSSRKIFLDKLGMEDSFQLWKWMGQQYLVEEDVDYQQLAGKYRLLPGLIAEIFARAEEKRWQEKKERISMELLLISIRECNQFSGNSFMERIDTVFTWKELRVEPQVITGMQLACAHLKYRFAMEKTMGKQTPYGKGIGVLMYGPPGTGKTMAAQVMANELGMELCRVDLSQVISKYIGETEKNLESVFREAEHSNIILFFDEADSLFGKRTEVKDSNDKYANQETSYILQRIESYEGMVILATNLVKNFDSAFMRRITISIRFSEPDEEMRKLLWKDMLQNTALAEDVVLIENLAKQFELTGSNIKSIVRNAIFMSFMEQSELRIEHIVKAIKVEFEKLGKIPNLSGFGMFFTYI